MSVTEARGAESKVFSRNRVKKEFQGGFMHLAMVGRDREERTILPVSNQEDPTLCRRSGRPSGGVAVPPS